MRPASAPSSSASRTTRTSATILVGSIPGILIGSHFTHRLPERALRGSIAGVLALSGMKLLGAF